MKKETDTVIFAVDEDPFYRRMALVSLFSLARVCKREIVVHFVVEPGARLSAKELSVLKILSRLSKNVSIICNSIPMKYEKLVDATGKCTHLGRMCCARFFLPLMFPDIGQCLYVDTDTLFLADPFDEIEKSYGDGMAMVSTAGVADPIKFFRPENIYQSMPWYVNGGVLLMDLDIWRHREIGQRLLFDTLTEHRRFNDQDSLNFIERPVSLSSRLNFMSNWMEYFHGDTEKYNSFYGTGYPDMDTAAKDACILHFVGRVKPFRDIGGDKPVPDGMKTMFRLYEMTYNEYLVTTKQGD